MVSRASVSHGVVAGSPWRVSPKGIVRCPRREVGTYLVGSRSDAGVVSPATLSPGRPTVHGSTTLSSALTPSLGDTVKVRLRRVE